MGRRLIEVMQVLVDQIHQGGYQHRVLEDSIYEESEKRIAAEKDRDHWKQARQEAHEAGELMKAEIETLKDEIKTLKVESSGLDQTAWYAEQDLEKAKAEIETLRQQLAEQQAETVDVRRQRNNETDRLNATNAVSVQQRDEIAYLRARLDEERSVSAGLRQQLDAALASLTGQRLNAEERDREIERLQAFVGGIDNLLEQDRFDRRDIAELLIVLRSNSSATLTSSPTPVTEPIDAEGGA